MERVGAGSEFCIGVMAEAPPSEDEKGLSNVLPCSEPPVLNPLENDVGLGAEKEDPKLEPPPRFPDEEERNELELSD